MQKPFVFREAFSVGSFVAVFCFVLFWFFSSKSDVNHFCLTYEKKYFMHREVICIRNQYLKCKSRLSCFEFLETINTSLENFQQFERLLSFFRSKITTQLNMESSSTSTKISSSQTTRQKEDLFPMDYSVEETSVAAAALLIIIIVCLMGNTVICYVFFRNRRMWTEMNMFLVNLAIGDIAMSLLSMTTPLQTAISGKWKYGVGPVCQLNAFFNSVLFCNTVFTHTAISIDRFFAVVKPMRKVMTRKKALSTILGVWVLSVVISLGPLFGWGENDYNASTLQCGFDFPENTKENLYILCLAFVAFLLPIVIMSYVYVRIYLVVRRHTKRLSTTVFGNSQELAIKKQRRTVLTFFLALMVFVICWTPFFVFIAVAVSVQSRDELPHGLGIAAYWCGFLNSAVNPYLIGLRSEKFHEAFKHLFCCNFKAASHENEARYYSTNQTVNTGTAKHVIKEQITSHGNGHDSLGRHVNGHDSLGRHVNSAFVNFSLRYDNDDETDSSPFRQPTKDVVIQRSRKQGHHNDAVAYPHFIHMAHGKLWSEATV